MQEYQRFVVAAAAALLAASCAPAPLPKLTYAERACYRTLADVDCSTAVLPAEQSRRVGFYDAPIAVEHEPWPQHLF